jgi:hypothetical protein
MTYGEVLASRMLTDYQIVAVAALQGDVDALTQLVETTAQVAYAEGVRVAVAVHPVGGSL